LPKPKALNVRAGRNDDVHGGISYRTRVEEARLIVRAGRTAGRPIACCRPEKVSSKCRPGVSTGASGRDEKRENKSGEGELSHMVLVDVN